MGAKITMPSFSSIVQAMPVDSGFNPGLGYYVGSGIANQLLSASQSVISNKQTKQAISGFADAVESSDPESAKIYRSLAENIPAFDPTSLNPSSGGSKASGTSGGGGMSFGGATGEVMSNMLDMVKLRTQQAGQLALENQRTKNDAMLQNLRSTAAMAEILAQKDKELAVQQLRGENSARVAEINHLYDGPELEQELQANQTKFTIELAKLSAAAGKAAGVQQTAAANNKSREKVALINAASREKVAKTRSSSDIKAPSPNEVQAKIASNANVRDSYAKARQDYLSNDESKKAAGAANMLRIELWANDQLQSGGMPQKSTSDLLYGGNPGNGLLPPDPPSQ